MKKILLWTLISLTVLFWPISMVLSNPQSWPAFILPALVLLLDWVLYLKNFPYRFYLYLLLPLIHPVYLIFPVIALLFNFRQIKKSYYLISYIVIFAVIVVFSIKTFYAYSLFTPDPLAHDTLVKKVSLAPHRYLIKLFDNRTTVFQDKFKANSFLSLDINNYFFSLHPREIAGENQNLNKFPYLAIIPFLIGLYFLPGNKHRKWLISAFISAILSVAFINNQDKFDFLLFIPISMICFYGYKKISELPKLYYWLYFLIFIPASIIELLRIIVYR